MAFRIAGTAKNYGPALTSYDVLKTAALLLMICDHVGYFFQPDLEVLRILGRFSAPIWFFLVGYAGTRPVPREWWIGGAIITLSAMAFGGYMLPASILFMLGVTRLTIDRFGYEATRGPWMFLATFMLLTALAIPTTFVLEYGTYGILCALYGYIRRHEESLKIDPGIMALFITGLVAVSVCFQSLFVPFMPKSGYILLGLGMAGVFIGLHSFKPKAWPSAFATAPNPVRLVQFLGRYTLEIYVIHLTLFRVIAFFTAPYNPGFFHFDLFSIKLW